MLSKKKFLILSLAFIISLAMIQTIHASTNAFDDGYKAARSDFLNTFIFAEHFYKSVSGVSPGEEINVCLTNFNTGAEDCDSATFNNNLSADVFVNIG